MGQGIAKVCATVNGYYRNDPLSSSTRCLLSHFDGLGRPFRPSVQDTHLL